MLLELKVANFVIIENIQISFRRGLNIISGETGAGKSIVLKSLSLLMGAKSQADMIRSGCKTATIEGYFDLRERDDITRKLEQLDIPIDENLLIVRRVVGFGGRSRIYLNNTLCTLTNLREIISPLVEITGKSAPLIELTGQHDNRQLMNKSFHIDMLDHYIGASALRQSLSSKFLQLSDLRRSIHELSLQSQQREQQLDYLRFQVDEIEQLQLNVGDETLIEENVHRLKNIDKISDFVKRSIHSLYSADDSVIEILSKICSRGDELSKFDPQLRSSLSLLAEVTSQLKDVAYELRDQENQTELDPNDLEEALQKLDKLRKLQKKFGASAEEILNRRQAMLDEIEKLDSIDNQLDSLVDAERSLAEELEILAEDLHKKRLSGGTLLSESVNEELSDLNMKGVCFESLVKKSHRMTANGFSDVEFLTRVSKKEPARPLSRVASGGELSRLLLSLKRVIGKGEYPRTILFDEVDTGVSGQTAEKVGRKLKSIGKGQQVICITHLPQVAAFGDIHFFIEKDPKESGVTMSVMELESGPRTQEIARLISGSKITETSMAHAEQLLADSKI